MIRLAGESFAALKDGDHILFTELLSARHCPSGVGNPSDPLRALREQRAEMSPTSMGLACQSIFFFVRQTAIASVVFAVEGHSSDRIRGQDSLPDYDLTQDVNSFICRVNSD